MLPFLRFCEDYKYVLSFFGMVTIHAIWVYYTVTEHERRIKKLEDDTVPIRDLLHQMDTKLNILVDGYKQ